MWAVTVTSFEMDVFIFTQTAAHAASWGGVKHSEERTIHPLPNT